MFKDRISFKKYYPAVRRMAVTDERIYVLTYQKQKEDTECIIFDLEGNEQKRVYVPLPQTYGMGDLINKKFLQGGPGGGQFFQKAPPLAAGGKEG